MKAVYREPHVTLINRDDSFILTSNEPLMDFAPRVLDYFRKSAEQTPDRDFLVERGIDESWVSISYGVAFDRIRAVAQFLIDRGCGLERPLAILSENSINHALMALGAIYAGIPAVPISAAYSTLPEAFERLLFCLSVVTPGALFVEDGERFGGVLEQIPDGYGIRIAAKRPLKEMLALDEVISTAPRTADAAFAATNLETVVKILFTSGSTGTPKGVVNTNRMLSANQQQLIQAFPSLAARPPRLVDWLPWSHTFGGNETFFMTMRHGGTMYIDAGKPMATAFQRSLRNIRDVSPTVYLNVPLGFDMLANAMERDKELRKVFFSDLDMLFYAGSALPQATWKRFDLFSEEVRGHRVPFVTGWGTTETAPLATAAYFKTQHANNIGVPVAGCEVKLVPADERYEIRVKGPNVSPGYWRAPEKTATLFDEEGYYKPGDAVKFLDLSKPSKGLLFEGRVAEDFKLSSGTWVPVGKIRENLINSLAPVAQDAVIVGRDWEYVAAMVFADHQGCAKIAGEPPKANEIGLIDNPRLLSHVRDSLSQLNKQYSASSMRIRRAILMFEPPSLKGYEITEKGYVNQRAVQIRRQALVEHLRTSAPDIIMLE